MTSMTVRIVNAQHGRLWIANGVLLFRRQPLQWALLLAILFVISHVLSAFPVLEFVAVVITPNFIAGIGHGAQAVADGKPLRLAYLASGFLKSAGALLLLGGISLALRALIMLAMVALGGEGMSALLNSAVGAAANDPAAAVTPAMAWTLVLGFALSILLMLALWFAPLLVFFDEVPPLQALRLSLVACLRNFKPMLTYFFLLLAPLLMLALLTQLIPTGIGARQFDLALWLLTPVIAPSIYTAYRDLFVRA